MQSYAKVQPWRKKPCPPFDPRNLWGGKSWLLKRSKKIDREITNGKNEKPKKTQHKGPMALKNGHFFESIYLFTFGVRSHVATLPPISMVQSKVAHHEKEPICLENPLKYISFTEVWLLEEKQLGMVLSLSAFKILYPHSHASHHKGKHFMT